MSTHTTMPYSQRARWAGGSHISHLMHKALAHPELISLAAGFVDQQSLPIEATREALDSILGDPRRARAALQYGTTAGYLPLREQLLERHLVADAAPPSEQNLSVDQFVLSAGSNQMLHLLGDTLLDPGDIVLCASPTYFVYLGILRNLGVRAVGVAADEQGIVPEALEQQLERIESSGQLRRVKAIYVVSYFDNPSTATVSAERRAAVVELAKRWSRHRKLYVIEDAAYRELRYSGPDVPSMRAYDAEGDTVIVTHTFSKSFSPGVRVGWAILPPELIEPVCDQKGNLDFGSPNFNQHLMASVLAQGKFDEHLARLQAAYRAKLQAMLAAADEHLADIPGVWWRAPQGGLYVWLQVPHGIDTGPDGPLFDRAVDEGVLYVPGEYCYPTEGEPVARNMIRLSFGVQPPERIAEGMAALARALRAALAK